MGDDEVRDERPAPDERDRRADASDAAAAQADMGENLLAWLHDDDRLGAAHDQRQAAARERDTARAARRSAAAERSDREVDEADEVNESA